MQENIFNSKITEIRRAKKAVTDEAWSKSFLRTAQVGVLATVFQDQPFVSTKLFVYDEQHGAIYLHSADEGRVWQNIQLNPKICFTAHEIGRFLPSVKACKFGVEYASVVVFGVVHVVGDQVEILAALQLFMDKYAPHLLRGLDYPPISSDDLDGLAVYRLEITGWSAKQSRADPDFPGAYRLEDLSGK